MSAEQADRAIALLEEIRAALSRQIETLVARLATEPGTGALAKDKVALANATKVRQQVFAAMQKLGVEPALTVAEERSAAAAREAARAVNLGTFEPDTVGMLDKIVSGQLDEVTATFKEAEAQIARAMRIGTTTGAPLNELIREVGATIDASFSKAQAAVDSAVMGANRLVRFEAGEKAADASGEEYVYLYEGPDDAKIRPFCKAHIGRAYTKAALERMDAGSNQPGPVRIFLGGYRCRHMLVPMSIVDALDEGIEVVT